MTKRTDSSLPDEAKDFLPARPRTRHDGWTPKKQHDFIAALAASGCVMEAARSVGMTTRSAYRLRARPDATYFRQAWDVALDFAIRLLGEAAFSRALQGVSRPVFYQGEQIGERRHYDERLTMFLLRYRDPVRFGAWLDGYEARRHPDGAGIVLAHALNTVLDSAHGFDPDPDLHPDEVSETALPRALAEGPKLDVTAADRESVPENLDPDLHDLYFKIRAGVRRGEEADADPVRHDWRETNIVRRRTTRKGAF